MSSPTTFPETTSQNWAVLRNLAPIWVIHTRPRTADAAALPDRAFQPAGSRECLSARARRPAPQTSPEIHSFLRPQRSVATLPDLSLVPRLGQAASNTMSRLAARRRWTARRRGERAARTRAMGPIRGGAVTPTRMPRQPARQVRRPGLPPQWVEGARSAG